MRKNFKNIDWKLLICTIVLIGVGLLALYSATQSAEHDEFKKQIIWLIAGIPILIITICVDYSFLIKISPIFYGVFIILLIVVLFTNPINGARSWFPILFFSFQPGEFAKIFVILFYTFCMAKMIKKDRDSINKLINLLILISIIMIPVFLIVLQPDYGTAIAFLIALIVMLFTAGINKRYIIVSLILAIILLPILYMFVLPEHAKDRIEVYLNPNIDPRGAGYNIIQSKLAIGAGKLFGLGWLQGTQTQLGFLYPKSTDFIFAVIGEEFGFIMLSFIIILYIILITRGISIAKNAKDVEGSILASGIVGIFLFHIVQNIGMTVGLLPITGVPLPFISYGGSALITNIVFIGVLINISAKQKSNIFEK